jgi:glycosyltransferase involved in cell wall biosynthesis
MKAKNKFLFNFAVSYLNGGLKRLYEYAKWFDANGGASFIVHPSCYGLAAEFPNNRFFFVCQTKLQRFFNDCGYLDAILSELGKLDLYYSNGIPIYSQVAACNLFHLCNVLTLGTHNIPLSHMDHVKWFILGLRIKKNLSNADLVSAESASSLRLICRVPVDKLFVSVLGSDDELAQENTGVFSQKDNVATVVGTVKYKSLNDSYRVFQMLRDKNPGLKLVVIGRLEYLSKEIFAKDGIIFKGLIPRQEVMEVLKKTRFYISTTRIEGSYNAASEGVFFADESYISDIGPHRELLNGMPCERLAIPGLDRAMIHVKRNEISGANLKTWNNVITDMISRMHKAKSE